MPFGVLRRKAKMTEVARIVLPPKREESEPQPASTEPTSAVVPPAFPVAAMTVRASQKILNPRDTAPLSTSTPVESVADEKVTTKLNSPEPRPVIPTPPQETEPANTEKERNAPERATSDTATRGDKPEVLPTEKAPIDTLKPETAEKLAVPATDLPPAPNPLPKPTALFPAPPKVDPKAHKPEPTAELLPKADPEAHKPAPTPAPTVPMTQLTAPPVPQEKREFHLANGERVAGIVLSETPEAIYVEHGTLGVITIPRAQIAKRLVEIILINGDRIVGDIMAETADTLYVRHASLGMLTVPRAQRSTRVVEAILTDGDRILGEVLTETDSFTVIRSATLGTVTVPHSKISMLNRKIEQIQLKALPPSAPEIKDKPAA
jgi:RNase P/RNase MRP subunit p29